MDRSEMMSRIRGRDTQPELLVRKLLFARGFRYRVNVRKLPGSPDIVLSKYRAVIFIHGCFWHGHDCKNFRIPKTHSKFWADKIMKNQLRDQNVAKLLESTNWRVMVIWECRLKELRKDGKLTSFIDQVSQWIVSGND